jgi:hyperosmotically inducible protein
MTNRPKASKTFPMNRAKCLTKEIKMNLSQTKSIRSALWTAAAGALVLNLAACGPQGTTEKAGKDMDRTTANADQQLDQASGKAAQKPEQSAGAPSGLQSAETAKSIDDLALTGKVKSALIAEPNLSSLPIDVEAEKGVVTLNGKVTSDSDREKVASLVASVEGVKAVKNNLAVASSS